MEALNNCLANVNRRKRFNSSEPLGTLQRCLNIVDLTYIGIGAMIGTGLFVVGGEVAKKMAGPAVVLSFALGAFAALLSAYCYAEFSSHVARTGSAYIYTYVGIGELWAFTVGWNMVLEYLAMLSSVSRAISATVDSVLDSKIKNAIIEEVLGGSRWKSNIFEEYPDLFAGAIAVIVTITVSFGAKVSSNLTMICVNVLFAILILVTAVALYYGDLDNFTSDGGYFPFGIGGVLEGAAVCFVTYSGFEVICISSDECTSPKKSIPVALGTSLGIVSLTYILVSGSLTYLVSYKDIVPEAAFSEAFIEEGVEWMGYIVTVAIVVAGVSTLITGLYFLARLIYAFSLDGLFYKTFSTVNPSTQVPVRATVLFGAVGSLLAVFFKYDVLVTFLSIGTLCAYTIMSGAVIVLRYRPKSNQTSLEGADNDRTVLTQSSDSGIDDESEFTHNNDIGTLRNMFKGLPILRVCEPGTAVPIALMGFVFFFGIAMLLIQSVPHVFSSVPLTVLVVTLLSISLICFLIIPLHKHAINPERIQVPFIPYLPLCSITINIILMTQLDYMTWIRLLLWIALGYIIYGTYGYWHSEERYKTDFPNNQLLRPAENEPKVVLYGTLELESRQPSQ